MSRVDVQFVLLYCKDTLGYLRTMSLTPVLYMA
jgi:hypothetical protein